MIQPSEPLVSPYLTSKEACQYLKCHWNTLELACLRNKIKFVNLGRHHRFKTEWLDQFLERKRGKYD